MWLIVQLPWAPTHNGDPTRLVVEIDDAAEDRRYAVSAVIVAAQRAGGLTDQEMASILSWSPAAPGELTEADYRRHAAGLDLQGEPAGIEPKWRPVYEQFLGVPAGTIRDWRKAYQHIPDAPHVPGHRRSIPRTLGDAIWREAAHRGVTLGPREINDVLHTIEIRPGGLHA